MSHNALYRECCCGDCSAPTTNLPDSLIINGSYKVIYKTCRKYLDPLSNVGPCNGGQIEVICQPQGEGSSSEVPLEPQIQDTNFVDDTTDEIFNSTDNIPLEQLGNGNEECENCFITGPDYVESLSWERESILEVKYQFTGTLYKSISPSGNIRYVGNLPNSSKESDSSVPVSWNINLSVSGTDFKDTVDCLNPDCCAGECFPIPADPFGVYCRDTISVDDSFEDQNIFYPIITLECKFAPSNIDEQKENCNWINFNPDDFPSSIKFPHITIFNVVQDENTQQSIPEQPTSTTNGYQWPPPLQFCPGPKLICNFEEEYQTCDCFYEYDDDPLNPPNMCIPHRSFPFRSISFISQNGTSFIDDYVCYSSSRGPRGCPCTQYDNINFIKCDDSLNCPGFTSYAKTGDYGEDGEPFDEFKDFWIIEYDKFEDIVIPGIFVESWRITGHTIVSSETSISITEPVS